MPQDSNLTDYQSIWNGQQIDNAIGTILDGDIDEARDIAVASAESAYQSAESAAASASTALQYSGNPAKPINGTWWIWDATTQQYVDSGISSTLTIKHSYPSIEDMNADFANTEENDLAIISGSAEDVDTAKLYIHPENGTQWQYLSDLSGIQGPPGEDGTSGKSAYQEAVEGGYTGTEEQFKSMLASGPWLPTAGGTVNGTLNFASSDALRFLYPHGPAMFLAKYGELHLRQETGTDGVILSGIRTPTNDDHATNKKYVDDAVANAGGGSDVVQGTSVVIGPGALVDDQEAQGSVAIGNGAYAANHGTIAMGSYAYALAEYSVSIGYNAAGSYSSAQSVIIGMDALVEENAQNSICIGPHSKAGWEGSVAIGCYAYAEGENSIAIGCSSLVASYSSYNSVAIGSSAKASRSGSVSIGYSANNEGYSSVAIGCYAHIQPESMGSVGIGNGANAGCYSIAIGGDASADQYESISIGHNAQGCYANNTIAIGPRSAAMGTYAISMGTNAHSGKSGVSVGQDSKSLYDGSVSVGANASCNGGAWSVALGYNATCAGTYSCAIGADAKVDAGSDGLGHIQLGYGSLSVLSCAVSLTVTSDIRDKADVIPVKDGAIELLEHITPITYHRNPREIYVDKKAMSKEEQDKNDMFSLYGYDKEAHTVAAKKGTRNRIGVSAQQVQEALEAVYGDASYANIVNDNFHDLDPETIPDGLENRLTVNYEGFIPFLIKAIQELSAKVKELEGIQK